VYSPHSKLAIGKLRVIGDVSDAPSVRLAVSSFFDFSDFSDLRAPGVSPHEVLFVRKLSDSLPGRVLAKSGQSFRHYDWEQSVRDQLDDMHRIAVRPYKGVVPANGEAVLFSDRAEMLASFTLDLLKGQAGQHWWWKTLLDSLRVGIPPVQRLMESWQQDINLLPSILEHLYIWGQVETTLSKLSANETVELSLTLSKAYELSILATLLESVQLTKHDSLLSQRANINQADEGAVSDEIRITHSNGSAAIWKRLLPNFRLSANLSLESGFLLSLGLAIQRAPWRCRNSLVQKELAAAWLGAVSVPGRLDMSNPINPDTFIQDACPAFSSEKEAQSDHMHEQGIESVCRSDATLKADEITQGMNSEGQENIPDIAQKRAVTVEVQSNCSTNNARSNQSSKDAYITPSSQDLVTLSQEAPSETAFDLHSVLSLPDTQLSSDHSSSDTSLSPHENPQVEAAFNANATQPYFSAEGVITQLGGVLYLINLMQRLNLPACFEDEWHLQSMMSPWAILELIARGLLLQTGDDYSDDPLWGLLAHLDGRKLDEPVGKNFVSSERYKVPASWMQYISKESSDISYAGNSGRLWVWDSKGFLLAEQKRCTKQSMCEQALTIVNSFDDYAVTSVTERSPTEIPLVDSSILSTLTISDDLTHWLCSVLPYMNHLLIQLTGVEGNCFDTSLLQCRGRLFVTNTHIDFCTGLENISPAIRCAGLDQDPGWLPEVGRVVLFHFD